MKYSQKGKEADAETCILMAERRRIARFFRRITHLTCSSSKHVLDEFKAATVCFGAGIPYMSPTIEHFYSFCSFKGARCWHSLMCVMSRWLHPSFMYSLWVVPVWCIASSLKNKHYVLFFRARKHQTEDLDERMCPRS